MSVLDVLYGVSLLFLGVLAGEEFIVRYGVQPALRSLDDRAHVAARVALVKRLRIVVPALMLPAVVFTAVATIVGGTSAGCWWRFAGAAALAAFLLFSFLGTVPINMKVIDWDADSPPEGWRRLVARWELLDVFRSSAALLAFALFLVGAVVR